MQYTLLIQGSRSIMIVTHYVDNGIGVVTLNAESLHLLFIQYSCIHDIHLFSVFYRSK